MNKKGERCILTHLDFFKWILYNSSIMYLNLTMLVENFPLRQDVILENEKEK